MTLGGFWTPNWTPSAEIAPNGASCRPPKSTGLAAETRDGEAQNRTGDTTIFSRVLYRLSYLAA
jgi:hypothetical protein